MAEVVGHAPDVHLQHLVPVAAFVINSAFVSGLDAQAKLLIAKDVQIVGDGAGDGLAVDGQRGAACGFFGLVAYAAQDAAAQLLFVEVAQVGDDAVEPGGGDDFSGADFPGDFLAHVRSRRVWCSSRRGQRVRRWIRCAICASGRWMFARRICRPAASCDSAGWGRLPERRSDPGRPD